MPISNIQNIVSDDLIKARTDTLPVNASETPKETPKAIDENVKDSMKNVNEILKDNLDNQEIHDAVYKMNKTLQIFNKRLQFTFHEEAKRIVVKIIDTQTDKVVREIPAKEVLSFISRLHQSLGVLIDKKR